MKMNKSSISSPHASIITRVFPGSWFSKFKQRGTHPEVQSVEARRRGKLDFPGPCSLLPPGWGELRFYSAGYDDDDDNDAYWRISFHGNGLEGSSSMGGVNPLWHDSDDASQVSVSSFNTYQSCSDMKKMKEEQHCGDSTVEENGIKFGRKKPTQEAQLSNLREKDVNHPRSRKMRSRFERKREGKSERWPAEIDDFSTESENMETKKKLQDPLFSDSHNQRNGQILDQFTVLNKEYSNLTHHRASVSEEQNLGDKKLNVIRVKKKSSYRRRHSGSRKIKQNAGNAYPSKTDFTIRGLNDRKKARMKLKRERKAQVEHGRTIFDSFAVVKSSVNPRQDFRDSMAEMIREKGIKQPEELEELLASYLTLNCDGHHDLIIKVFLEVCFELNKDAC